MKLSIAVPAYNAEKTLERTVQTILDQTFTDFEILIVNNGSKDATGEIARRLAVRDSRIQVFDVYPNIWGYGARLYAWSRAKGEYIASVDADDFIAPEMYGKMVGLADEHQLDVVECNYDEYAADTVVGSDLLAVSPHDCPPPKLLLTREEVLDQVVKPTFVDVGQSAYVWNKIYRNQYDFSQWLEGVFGSYEDLIHNLQLFRPVKRYGYIDAPFYHYAPNAASVTRNFSEIRIDQFITTIAAKRKLVAQYPIADTETILDRWLINDVKNGIVSAATAGALPIAERTRLVNRLLNLSEVKSALAKQPIGSVAAGLLRVLKLLPTGFAIFAFQMLLKYHEFVVYCMIGGSGVVVDFAAFWLFNTGCDLHYQLANFLSFSVANFSNFVLNARFNFKVRNRLAIRFLSFYGVGILSWFLGAGFLYALFEKCGIPVLISKAIALVAVTAVQFTLNKLVTFRKGRK